MVGLLNLNFTLTCLLQDSGIRSAIRDAVRETAIRRIGPFTAYNVDIPRPLLKEDSSLSHGPLQEQRDQFLGSPLATAKKCEWDRKHIDDPPEV